MEWYKTDAQSLAIIDTEITEHQLSAAKYEIVRQVIYATADFEYKDLIQFSDRALEQGAAAIAARTPIVVDVATVQVAITPTLQAAFANAAYTSTAVITRPQNQKSASAWGIETLAQRYPQAVFAIGESPSALAALIQLIEAQEASPALVIATPTEFFSTNKQRLLDLGIPYIVVEGRKGNAIAAATILNTLVLLTWQAYGAKSD
jgi:precorrin-8X/cobalt-precorrin-8 methylmutase